MSDTPPEAGRTPSPPDATSRTRRARPAVYTRTGDDGTTGLLYGGRVRKDAPAPVAYGDVDEAQAVVGVARAHLEALASAGDAAGDDAGEASDDAWLAALLIDVARDLWVLMAELATAPENRRKLDAGSTLVTGDMVAALERRIDEVSGRFDPPAAFVVPGEDLVAAHLDVARTVVRRAERHAVAAAHPDSKVVPYLNRLSDLLWVLARWREGTPRPVADV